MEVSKTNKMFKVLNNDLSLSIEKPKKSLQESPSLGNDMERHVRARKNAEANAMAKIERLNKIIEKREKRD